MNTTQPAPRVVYELQKADLDQAITDRLEALQREAVLGRFSGRLVSVNTVAEIHNVKRDTVTKYAKLGLLPHLKTGKLYKFDLSKAMQFDFNELRRIS